MRRHRRAIISTDCASVITCVSKAAGSVRIRSRSSGSISRTSSQLKAGGSSKMAKGDKNLDPTPDANRDPITKEPGSHAIGTAGGAGAGAAAGAAIGSVAGPAGALVGGAIGAVVGGKAGHNVGEKVNPTVEEGYWRENYGSRPYVNKTYSFDDYVPAYRTGWESRARYADRRFDEVESDLGRDWDRMKGKSRLKWEEAKAAARDAW